jgi:SAM-dependent methyltransferase
VRPFPKQRPPLPPEYQALYEEHIKRNRQGAQGVVRLSSRMEAWMHRRVAKHAAAPPGRVLEIGAGTLNHVPYERSWSTYEVVEPFADLYTDSPYRGRVRTIYADLSEVPADQKYEKIVSIAVFEHICDLPGLLQQAVAHLSPGGELVAAIPSEGTILWTLGWKLTTGLEFRLRHGLDYSVIMRHEHVNTSGEIEAELHRIFSEVDDSSLGISPRFSFYRCFRCCSPR